MPPKKRDDSTIFTDPILQNFYLCLIVGLNENAETSQLTTGEVLVANALCWIRFKTDQYRSHLEISIDVPKNEEKGLFHTSYLRFDALNIHSCTLDHISN